MIRHNPSLPLLATLLTFQAGLASPVISEFMAVNGSTLADSEGEFSDWIEIHNPDATPVNLGGWHLTDDASDLTKWTFPAVTLEPGSFLVVFASNKDRIDPETELHTNFKLSGGGEFLALVMPNGSTTTTSFSPSYPQQIADVGYGTSFSQESTPALEQGAATSVIVPDLTTGPALGQDWWDPSYVEGSRGETWNPASAGVGFGADYSSFIGGGGDLTASMLNVNSSAYIRSNFTIDRLEDVDGASLRMRYDDGFIAYLNGEEIARANFVEGGGRAPESGLVTYYDFDGDLDDDADEYTNGSGVATDTLTPFGVGTYEPGIVGQAVRISSGGFQRLRTSDSDDLDLASSWTLEAFVRPDSGNTGEWDRFWTKWGDGGNQWHWTFRGSNNGSDLFINGSTNVLNNSSTAEVPLNVWSHVAIVGDEAAGTITAWLNGVQVGSATWQAVTSGSGAMNFGNNESPANGFQYSGLIDEAAIWSVALTPAQLASHAAAINNSPASAEEAYGLTPIQGGNGLSWRSTASEERDDGEAQEFAEFDLSSQVELLQVGNNVLAIQGLNSSNSANHFLIDPELNLMKLTTQDGLAGYLSNPSPGAPNPLSNESLGPIVASISHSPVFPSHTDAITVTALVTSTLNPLGPASLVYRVNFGNEITIPMTVNASGEYIATIPAGVASPRDMVRWRIIATDSENIETEAPAFNDPTSSPRYDGTVVSADDVQTELDVLHWFVEDAAAAETGSGTRASVAFNGEFYDNVFVRIRGDTARGWPKKSYKFDFNNGYDFRFDPNLPRVDEINVNTTYTDKSYSRTILAYETFRDAGSPHSVARPFRVQQNGNFFSVAIFVEQPDRDYLRRNNLDDEGALYKFKANSIQGQSNFNREATFGAEKRNRREEDFSDLQELIDNMALSGEPLSEYIFDHVDVPAVVNNLATNVVIQNIDRTVKNFYLYRDTEGNGEWRILPWDVDLSFGPNRLNTNTIVTAEDTENNSSHPFMGTEAVPYTWLWNGLIDAMITRPETQEMFLRRLRTLTDDFLGTDYYPNRIDELTALMAPDVAIDRQRWGGSAHFSGTTLSLAGELNRIRNEYLPGRLSHLRFTHGGVVGSGAVLVSEMSPVSALVPLDDSLGNSWQVVGFDDSSWLTGTGGVGYERSMSETFTPFIGLDLLSPDIPASQRIDTDGDGLNENNSCYIRYEFDLEDRDAIEFLRLRVRYDDGFAVYLNGTQIAVRNEPSPLAWNSEASDQNTDERAVEIEEIDVTPFRSSLLNGQNVLAVHALNRGSNSSDMLFSVSLVDEGGVASGVGIPGPQPDLPMIQFGEIDFNPASGVQDEEFIELINPNHFSVDVSGWQLSGGVEMTLDPGTVIRAGSRLYLSPDSNFFRARAVSPSGNEGHFVQDGYRGHLSNLGEPLMLTNSAGNLITETTSPADPSDEQLYLAITEVNYHPVGNSGEEFIELTNISDSITLDLSGVSLVDGVEFDFSGTLAPGAHILVVRNLAAFEAKYGPGLPVVGEFQNLTGLSNDGERVRLEQETRGRIVEFTYNDRSPWPEAADGLGASLVLINPTSMPDPSLASNWRPSTLLDGSPGQVDSRGFSGDPNADLDGNGLADLVDHFLAGEASPRLIVDENGIRFEFSRDLAADDVTFEIEISTDLAEWTDGSGLFQLSESVFTGQGAETLSFSAGPSAGLEDRLFVRLKVLLNSSE